MCILRRRFDEARDDDLRMREARYSGRGAEYAADGAIGRVNAGAMRAARPLDMYARRIANGLRFRARVHHRHHRWQQELEDGGEEPANADVTRAEVHCAKRLAKSTLMHQPPDRHNRLMRFPQLRSCPTACAADHTRCAADFAIVPR